MDPFQKVRNSSPNSKTTRAPFLWDGSGSSGCKRSTIHHSSHNRRDEVNSIDFRPQIFPCQRYYDQFERLPQTLLKKAFFQGASRSSSKFRSQKTVLTQKYGAVVFQSQEEVLFGKRFHQSDDFNQFWREHFSQQQQFFYETLRSRRIQNLNPKLLIASIIRPFEKIILAIPNHFHAFDNLITNSPECPDPRLVFLKKRRIPDSAKKSKTHRRYQNCSRSKNTRGESQISASLIIFFRQLFPSSRITLEKNSSKVSTALRRVFHKK